MKRIFTLIILSLTLAISAFSSDNITTLNGIFQGLDLYVNNPMLDEGKGEIYCVNKIEINDEPYVDVINSSAFRIALSELDLELGSPISISIYHSENCKPRIINPQILEPLSTYDLVDMQLGFENMLEFTTKGESSKLTFNVQQFRWGKWVNVSSLNGKGGPNNQKYSVQVYPCNGENKFRVYQTNHFNKVNMSDTKSFMVSKDTVLVETKLKKVKNEIVFSNDTYYVVQNGYGEQLLKDFGSKIDVSELPKGMYYLKYENTWSAFKKKK